MQEYGASAEESLREMVNRIHLGVIHNQFSIEFLECGWPLPFIDRLREECRKFDIDLQVLDIRGEVLENVLQHVLSSIPAVRTQGFSVGLVGLETSILLAANEENPAVLQRVNLARENYKQLGCPFVVCLSKKFLRKFQRCAPDFWAWRSAEPLRVSVKVPFLRKEVHRTLSSGGSVGWGESVKRISRLDVLLELYHEACSSNRMTADPSLELQLISSLGDAYRSIRKYSKARKWYENALRIAESLDESEESAGLLNKLGIVMRQLEGSPAQALSYFQRYLEHARSREDAAARGAALTNIGLIHYDMGRMDLALRTLNEALALHSSRNDSSAMALTLRNLGLVLRREQNFESAVQFIKRAIAESLKAGKSCDQDLVSLGLTYADQGLLQNAVFCFFTAIYYSRMGEDLLGEKEALVRLAECIISNNMQYFDFDDLNVRELQELLNLLGGFDVAVDGIWGPSTLEMMVRFLPDSFTDFAIDMLKRGTGAA